MFWRWIVESGVSRGMRTSCRSSLSATLRGALDQVRHRARGERAERAHRARADHVGVDLRRAARVRRAPVVLVVERHLPPRACSRKRASVSSRESRASPYSSVASTSTAAPRRADADLAVGLGQRLEQPRRVRRAGRAGYAEEDAHRDHSTVPSSLLASRCSSYAATLAKLRGIDSRATSRPSTPRGRSRAAEPSPSGERRHRRARVHARRALQVVDLELDALALRALVPRGRARRGSRAGAEVRVAVQAADLGEQLRAGDRASAAGCSSSTQLGTVADVLARRATPSRSRPSRSAPHRDHDEDRRDDRDRAGATGAAPRRRSRNGSASSSIMQDRRDPDRAEDDRVRPLEDPEQVEEEVEVPVGPRDEARRPRVGLVVVLRAEPAPASVPSAVSCQTIASTMMITTRRRGSSPCRGTSRTGRTTSRAS